MEFIPKYAIICYKRLDAENIETKHKCLYMHKPDEDTILGLQHELATDEEFGMVGDDDYEMILISKVDETWKTFDLPYVINDEDE